MSNEPQERLVLLRLALEGGETKNTDFKPDLKKQDRDRLVNAGLIEAEKRRPPKGGRAALYLVLTDEGWAWLAEHLDGELPPQAKPVRTLQKLLACLKAHLDARGYSLADFITGPPSATKPGSPADIEKLIELAYLRLSGGRANVHHDAAGEGIDRRRGARRPGTSRRWRPRSRASRRASPGSKTSS